MVLRSVSQQGQPKRFCRIQLDILPPQSELVIDRQQRVATLLQERQRGDKTVVEQVRLIQQEMDLFVLLCQRYPEYASHAELFSTLSGQSLQACLDMDLEEEQIHHARHIVSHLRQKIRSFRLSIAPLLQLGYQLQAELAPARYGKREAR
jgi:DNA-binding winged helix-turn-helix (wHTH) protein